MSLQYKASLSLTGILIPLFSLFASVLFALSLQITALLSLSLSLSVSLVLPTVSLALSLTLALIAQFTIALGISLPSFSLDLQIALDFELVLVLGFLASLEIIIDAIAEESLVAYAWFGPGAALGGALTNAIGGGWPDGTDSGQPITAYLFVATTAGDYSKDQIASLGMMPVPAPPPAPQDPPPPDDAYPPPQAYERGLVGISISAPTAPGGTQATGTVEVDDSIAPGIGAVIGVSIVDHGSGYTSMPSVEVTDTVEIVSATTDTPIVVKLPNPLDIPVGEGLGISVSGVIGTTTVESAGATSPIIIRVSDTTGLVSCQIQPGDYGLEGLIGTWYVRALSDTQAELWSDAEFSIPSSGSGAYVLGSATLSGNICGGRTAKVLSPTTIALYTDADMLIPVSGYGTYEGGTVTGGGCGAAVLVTMGGGPTNALQSLLDGLHWSTSPALEGGVITFKAMLLTVFTLMLDLKGNLQVRANILGSIKLGFDFIPPTIDASLELLGKISANLSANLAVELPSLTASISATLNAQIDAVASLVARIGFFLGLATGNVTLEIWQYDGPGSGLGPAIASGPGSVGWHDMTPASTSVSVAVFGLTNPASATAFQAIFPGA